MPKSQTLTMNGKKYTFARCTFCEDGFMTLVSDVKAHTKDGKWLCSVCRNIPAEKRAAIEAGAST